MCTSVACPPHGCILIVGDPFAQGFDWYIDGLPHPSVRHWADGLRGRSLLDHIREARCLDRLYYCYIDRRYHTGMCKRKHDAQARLYTCTSEGLLTALTHQTYLSFKPLSSPLPTAPSPHTVFPLFHPPCLHHAIFSFFNLAGFMYAGLASSSIWLGH